MAMHDNIRLENGVKVDLYDVVAVARGTEIRWQNVGSTSVFDYSDNTVLAPDDRSKYRRLYPGQERRAVGDQYVYVWSDWDGEISVETV